MTATGDEQTPTTAEFALLSAARSGRLRRFYYVNTYVDAVTGGLMGGGGGKVDSQRLMMMVGLLGWLEPLPETSTDFDATWTITEAGQEARKRYLSRPRAAYRMGGKKK